MMTFKQLEAIYWVAQLGGFSQAANKLHTTQSAVSKRVHELEMLFSTPLFDRSLRNARLTEKGEEMFVIAKQLLAQRDAAVEQFVSPEVIERRLKIGVTELTALTWLPRLVTSIQTCFPKVIIEPDVDMTASLRDKLLADEVDLIIVPNVMEDARFTTKLLGKVDNAWMCKPGLLDASKPLRIHELTAHRLLIQGQQSGTGIAYGHWLKSVGVQPTNTIVCNSLLAMIGMAVSGLGISYLPRRCLSPLKDKGALQEVKTTPSLPETTYVAMYKGDLRSALTSSVVMLAQECCDFSHMYQIE